MNALPQQTEPSKQVVKAKAHMVKPQITEVKASTTSMGQSVALREIKPKIGLLLLYILHIVHTFVHALV